MPELIHAGTALDVGTIAFDTPGTSDNLTCTIGIPDEDRDAFSREMYVTITDDDVEFLGRIVGGPFHFPPAPDGQNGHGRTRGQVEVLGILSDGERLLPSATRPRPGARVAMLPEDRLRRLLSIEGNLYMGLLEGYHHIPVRLQSTSKNFLPRNVGIFGTVGSGKSNTTQVLVEELIAAGWAVVLVDVEGEYVRMNDPSDDAAMTTALADAYGMHPQGVEDFRVYVPLSGTTDASAPIPFKIPIAGLQPDIVADILAFDEAEARIYSSITEQAARVYGSNKPGANGSPARPFSLQHLIDGLIEGPTTMGYTPIPLLPNVKPHEVPVASVLRSKLTHLGTSGMMDWNQTAAVAELPVDDLVVGGRLSVLDVSETDDRSRNLAIAYVLQRIFEEVLATPAGEMRPNGVRRPPVLLMIEEVHTFISRATIGKMHAVLDMLQIISRRGRKRWMALGLISQQPSHVPNELFELANTRFIHQLKSLANIEPVKQTTGSVEEALWANVPGLQPGQCLVAGPALKHPLFVKIRPAASRRLLVI